MNNTEHLFPPELLAEATSIPKLAIAHAWPVALASRVIAALEPQAMAVLGGDILQQDNGEWGHVMPNWSCELQRGESWESFVRRSQRYAIDFLRVNYGQEDTLFVLVIQVKPTAMQLAKAHAR